MGCKQIVILGAGGDGLDVLDFIADINDRAPTYEVAGFLDDNLALQGRRLGGKPVLGPVERVCDFPEAFFVMRMGGPSSFWRNEAFFNQLGLPLERFETIVHPTAKVARSCHLGHGNVVAPFAAILANARLGNLVSVATQSVVNHDCVVGDFTILTTGVKLSGRVTVGRGCYLGTGATIIQDATIGDLSLIGMGSVVTGDVRPNSVMLGNPARRLRSTIEGVA